MRPGDFSPGNAASRLAYVTKAIARFNEAGGFLPRKRRRAYGMRVRHRSSFNEAGGFLPRKQEGSKLALTLRNVSFNEAGGFLPRKRAPLGVPRSTDSRLQ